MPDDQNQDSTGKGTAQAAVSVNGTDVPKDCVGSVVIDQDVDAPDMAAVLIKNDNANRYTETLKLGDSIEVKISESGAGQPASIFKGEVAGLEPNYEAGGETNVLVRAFNKMHLLTRGKQYKTYEKKTDAEIAKAIAAEVSLSAKTDGAPSIRHDHVYLHGQTYLEFLLERARRVNCELLVDDTTLIFRKRDLSPAETMTLELGAKDDSDGAPLKRFHVRLSSANQVNAVKVRSWDPNAAKEIVGEAKSIDVTLGKTGGADASKKAFTGTKQVASYDVPVASTEEANAVAKALLEDFALNYITGEGICKGNPKLKAGILVKVKATDARADGKYFVQGCTHKYSHKSGGGGGYQTIIRVRRNAEGA
jgi:phage protein D